MTEAASFPAAPPLVGLADGLSGRIREGAGETVFWVHGYTIDSSVWAELWARLPGWRHVGVDLPGHGGSAPLDADTTLRDLGERLAGIADAGGARHIVGLSLGAMIALEIALARPADFTTLTLGAPAIAGGASDPDVGRRYQEMAALWYACGGDRARMTALWMTSPPDLFRGAENHPALWGALRDVVGQYGWDEFHRPGVARLAATGQSVDDLPRLACRTLVLVGEHEFPAFRDTAQVLTAHIPNSSRAVLSGVGHLCMLEDPLASAKLIAAHLSGNNAAG